MRQSDRLVTVYGFRCGPSRSRHRISRFKAPRGVLGKYEVELIEATAEMVPRSELTDAAVPGARIRAERTRQAFVLAVVVVRPAKWLARDRTFTERSLTLRTDQLEVVDLEPATCPAASPRNPRIYGASRRSAPA
jgi:hypothetical protein